MALSCTTLRTDLETAALRADNTKDDVDALLAEIEAGGTDQALRARIVTIQGFVDSINQQNGIAANNLRNSDCSDEERTALNQLARATRNKVSNLNTNLNRSNRILTENQQAQNDPDPQDPAGEVVTTEGRITTEEERANLTGSADDERLRQEDAELTQAAIASATEADDDQSIEALQASSANASNTEQSQGSADEAFDSVSVNRSRSADVDVTIDTIETKSNLIKQFSSYSYKISLFRIKRQAFNQMQLGFGYTPGAGDLLMSSGGAGTRPSYLVEQNLDSLRNRNFDVDFYIDELQTTSIVGLIGSARNTNVTEMSFTIVEPYGVTLIERLIRVAVEDQTNYLQQPYMLSIEFRGYNSEGKEITGNDIGIATKYIPIKLTDFSFNITSSGSTYAVRAIPYNHNAYDIIRNTIPFNIELSADTVKNFFGAEQALYYNQNSERTDDLDLTSAIDNFVGKQTKGLAEALSDHQDRLVALGHQEYADEYAFEIDERIGVAQFNIDDLQQKLEETKIPMAKNTVEDLRKSAAPNISYNIDVKKFTVNQGTSISELINLILRRCTYFTDQLQTRGIIKKDQIKWWKIIPRIELKQYDRKRRQYAKKITYIVKYFPVQGRDTIGIQATLPSAPHKQYNYLFTGKNDDVIDFKLEFNSLYYQARSILPSIANNIYNVDGSNNSYTSIVPNEINTTQSKETQSVINSEATVKTSIAGDIMSDLLNKSADMIELDLQILGDPDYIDTSDFHIPKKGSAVQPVYFNDGSINYNGRECYVGMKLRTPVDYNANTGEMDPTQSTDSALVNGLYRLVEVQSNFSGGQFIQNLRGFKLNTFENNRAGSANRTSVTLTNSAGESATRTTTGDEE